MSGILADLAQVRATASWPAQSRSTRSRPTGAWSTWSGGPTATHGTAWGPHRDTRAVNGMTLEATAGYHRFLSGLVWLGIGVEGHQGRPPVLHGWPHHNRCWLRGGAPLVAAT